MPLHPHYYSAYPRAGDIAVLCEGDIVGYEFSILQKRLDARFRTKPLIDLWPCGSGAAIMGISDAIGRSRPIVVIEDRDYRSPAEAQKDCLQRRKNREDRGVSVGGWTVWRRNEIENYLIEPDIVTECFSRMFGCAGQTVRDTLAEILPSLAVHQSFQRMFYLIRKRWERTDPSPVLPHDIVVAPSWDDVDRNPRSPVFEEALQKFQDNLRGWRESGLDTTGLIDDLNSAFEQWRNPALSDAYWLNDWAGKDVLQWLRIALTSRYGLRDRQSSQRNTLQWSGLNRSRRDAQDRPIEALLKPFLVASFIDHISAIEAGELFEEWRDIFGIFELLNPQ